MLDNPALREALAVRSIGRQDLHAGDELDVFDTQFYARFISETRRGDFHDNTNEKTLLPVYEELEEAWGHAGSPLAGLVGAKVVEVFEHDDERMARLELRYLTKLTLETLIGLLYNAGVIRLALALGAHRPLADRDQRRRRGAVRSRGGARSRACGRA